MEKVKVGILGVGAIGSVMACQLTEQANIEIVLFNRTPKNRIQLQAPHRIFDIKITSKKNALAARIKKHQ